MSVNAGRFISFEGIDGTGKSTQIALLQDYLRKKGYLTLCLREPGGSALSEDIRALLLPQREVAISPRAELLLYEAARAQLCSEVIAPKLKEGYWVLCDRFFDSSTAYQGAGRKLKTEDIEWLNSFATAGLCPDITFYLHLDPREALFRATAQQEGDRLESEGLNFMEQVSQGFDALAERYPKRICKIEASGSPDEVFERVRNSLESFLACLGPKPVLHRS